MSDRLTEKVVLVTGATSGIGAEIARQCGGEGALVAVAGRSVERGEQVVEAVRSAGGEASFFPADVARVADCRSLVESVVEQLGRLDVLVQSAGVYEPMLVPEVTEDHFDQTIAINLKGTYFCGQAALAHMRERREGRVINMSSISGFVGASGSSVYCATKGAVLMLTRAWAVEYAPDGINVNCIAPGNVESPMNDHLMADPKFKEAALAMTPQGRNGRVEDIAPAVVMLASEDGAYFQGASLVIDGGWIAQ